MMAFGGFHYPHIMSMAGLTCHLKPAEATGGDALVKRNAGRRQLPPGELEMCNRAGLVSRDPGSLVVLGCTLGPK
jgi:hypothetical protein